MKFLFVCLGDRFQDRKNRKEWMEEKALRADAGGSCMALRGKERASDKLCDGCGWRTFTEGSLVFSRAVLEGNWQLGKHESGVHRIQSTFNHGNNSQRIRGMFEKNGEPPPAQSMRQEFTLFYSVIKAKCSLRNQELGEIQTSHVHAKIMF